MNIKEEREALFSSQHDVTGLWTAHRFSLWILCPCRQEDNVALDPSLCHLLDKGLSYYQVLLRTATQKVETNRL